MSKQRSAKCKKRGRPASGITKTVTNVSINREVLEAAKEAAAIAGFSLSGFVEQAVRATLTTNTGAEA